ncbi:MAG: hypothetical protein LC769_11010 [Chloroflexi bacterium]|nr:hypothetical protein [Chloroflexota bacterium]
MGQSEGQQTVAVTEGDSPSSCMVSVDGSLPGGKRFAHPVLVVVEYDNDEVVVTEPKFYMHASGSTETEAIEAFRRIFVGYLPFLEKQEERLGAHLLEQLDYLRSTIVPA